MRLQLISCVIGFLVLSQIAFSQTISGTWNCNSYSVEGVHLETPNVKIEFVGKNGFLTCYYTKEGVTELACLSSSVIKKNRLFTSYDFFIAKTGVSGLAFSKNVKSDTAEFSYDGTQVIITKKLLGKKHCFKYVKEESGKKIVNDLFSDLQKLNSLNDSLLQHKKYDEFYFQYGAMIEMILLAESEVLVSKNKELLKTLELYRTKKKDKLMDEADFLFNSKKYSESLQLYKMLLYRNYEADWCRQNIFFALKL